MDVRKTIIAVGLLLVSTAVLADPITAFLTSTFIQAGTLVITVGQVLYTAGTLLFGAAQQRKAKKRMLAEQRRQKDEYNAGLSDRTVNGIGSEFPARHVYGTARIGGNIVDIITTGDRDQYQHVIALATQHQIDDFLEIYINGKAVGALNSEGFATTAPFGKIVTKSVPALSSSLLTPGLSIPPGLSTLTLEHTPDAGSVVVTASNLDGNGNQYTVPFTLTGTTLTTDDAYISYTKFVKYTYQELESSIRITKHLGVPGGSYDVKTHQETNGKLKTTSVFDGHSYIAIRFDLNEPEFQSLPSIEMLVKRETLYDVRTGASSPTAGTNPANVTYDYLTGTQCKIPSAVLPISQFVTAANDCDAVVNNGDGDRKRYTFNGMISSDQSREEVLQRIAESMSGGIVATTWDIYAGVYRAPIMSLNETDIIGSLSVSPGASELEVFNTVYGRFVTAENAWLEKDYRRYVQSAYVASDGGELEVGITYPYTVTQTAVDQLNRIAMEQSRNDFTITALFSLKAWKLKVGDRVFWTSPFMGQTNTTYRVVDRATGYGAGVKLILKQDTPDIYDLEDATVAPSVPPSTLPNPWLVEPPQNVSVNSGTSSLTLQSDGTVLVGLSVSWEDNPAPVNSLGNVIEVQAERLTGTNLPDVITASAPNGSSQLLLSPVVEGATYRVRVRASNVYNGAHSTWVYALPHVVVGKTEPPPPLDNLKVIEQPGGVRQIFWRISNPPVDLFSFEFAYAAGDVRPRFEDMTPLPAKDREARQQDVIDPVGDGVFTFAGRCRDTAGNASLPIYHVVTLIADQFATIDAAYFPHQDGWPGVKQDCYVTGGALVNVGLDTWGNSPGSTWGTVTGKTWRYRPLSPMSYTAQIDRTTIEPRTLRAASLARGTAVIELRTSDNGSVWSAWAALPSGAVTARFYDVRWTVSGADPELYRAQIVFYQ